jgi:glycosyltransferase involved in cell wall biosynthesis
VSQVAIPPLLIALPDGLNVSGVTMWAVRLVNGLVQRGGEAGLVIHPEPAGQRRIGVDIDPRVRVWRIDVPRFGELPGDLSPCLPHYRAAVRAMGGAGDGSVVLSPNLHGDCYGVAAALCLADPERVRVVGWQHSDNEYDARVLAHYEPIVSRFVGVSDAVAATLRERVEPRRVVNLPHGVEVSSRCSHRRGAQLRLIYTGRLEHMAKRVLALVPMSEELSRRGVDHALTIAGDGPAMVELAAAARGMERVKMLGAVDPRRVTELLDEHDALVLPSRFEGLSVSVLEAMARGCVPIVARTRSGARQLIEDGVNGIIADALPEADEEEVGRAMAAAAERFWGMDRAAMSLAAWSRAKELSIGVHVERVIRLMRDMAGEVWREWPRGRGCAFTGREAAGERREAKAGTGGSGSVPAGGAERMRAVLERLAGRAVAIHGTGEHTRQLREVIVGAPVKLVAFTDDDRAKAGTRLWDWPVVLPREVGRLGVTDVVISSWMHQGAVWERRGVYEGQGVRVWRVYPEPETQART